MSSFRQCAGRAILFLVSSGLLATGCGPSAPSSRVEPTGTPTNQQPSPAVEGAGVVSAEQIAKDYLKDANLATKKYQHKLWVVDGIVLYHYFVHLSPACVSLTGVKLPDDANRSVSVQCNLTPAAVSKLEEVATGQKVKLRGKCGEFTPGCISFSDCDVLEIGTENQAIRVSAAQLAKEFASDAHAAVTKYGNKPVIVEGVVIETRETPLCTILLESFDEKAAKPMRVEVYTSLEESKGLTKGQKIKVNGECSTYLDEVAKRSRVAILNGLVINQVLP